MYAIRSYYDAMRYMSAFASHPERTWRTIRHSLQPYVVRSGTKATGLVRLMDEVTNKFKAGDFDNRPLTGKYLLGLSCQRHELYQGKNHNSDAEDASDEE